MALASNEYKLRPTNNLQEPLDIERTTQQIDEWPREIMDGANCLSAGAQSMSYL